RRHQISPPISALLAGAFAGSGSITFFFMQPWIESVFGFYPFLWMTWETAYRRGGWRTIVAPSLLVAVTLIAGTLQADAYLVVFGLGGGWGYAGRDLAGWKQWLRPVLVSGLLGASLAAPILFNEIELFRLSDRHIQLSTGHWSWLTGIASLTNVYPWTLGSF